MYYTRNIDIRHSDALYPYFDRIAHLSANLYNAALFRERQLMSSSKKEENQWFDNEREIRDEIKSVDGVSVPPSGVLSYKSLDKLMKRTNNPDYKAEGLPRQTAQHILKHVVRNIHSFFEALKQYQADPSLFTGEPKLPKYKHKGGTASFDISNQGCVIYRNKKGAYYAKLPLTKERLKLGKNVPGKLMEVHVIRNNGVYTVSLVFDDERSQPAVQKKAHRIASVDLGVNNLMAVTNNCGLECLIFNGKPLKSINREYNKRNARLVSAQTKGKMVKFKPTKQSETLCRKRNNRVHDYMLKSGKLFVTWCVENRIDTVVMGSNPFWKQEVNTGHRNNQNFVQIPFDQLKCIIIWLCERNGIRYVEQEESYTSKASFIDRDRIPVYGEEVVSSFSGKRIRRGKYQAKDGTEINADLNGSANILRKKYSDAFSSNPDFCNVRYIRHPDIELSK